MEVLFEKLNVCYACVVVCRISFACFVHLDVYCIMSLLSKYSVFVYYSFLCVFVDSSHRRLK